MKLSDLPSNTKATIISINCSEKIKRRLRSLGVFEKRTITMLRRAPLGDPIEFLVNSFCIAIRKEVCARVEVKVYD